MHCNVKVLQFLTITTFCFASVWAQQPAVSWRRCDFPGMSNGIRYCFSTGRGIVPSRPCWKS